MNFPNSCPSPETKEPPPTPAPPPRVPRLTSLLHRLQQAKDADGEPIALLDELLFFLEDPPPGTGDRWQKGADLCASHGIETSRMAVWRLYRGEILAWRRAQNPPPPEAAPTPEEIDRLYSQARQLLAQRILEALHDPRLAPGCLIGLMQNENHRQQIQLARDQFNDHLETQQGLRQQKIFQGMENEIREKVLHRKRMKIFRKLAKTKRSVPPHTTS